jgi:hypothetical protein
VTLKARLLANESRQAGALKHQVLALSGDTIFEALWGSPARNTLTGLLKNSYLRSAGFARCNWES